MNYSVFDLTFTYIQRFYTEEPNREEKLRILNQFEDLLFYGWTTEDIVKSLRAFQVRYPGQRPDLPQLFSKLNPTSNNLLKPNKTYYHNELRLMPGPPKRELDYNTGEIKKVVEEYFLEIRASYTIDNLVDYFIKQFDLPSNGDERKRYIGGFKYLLKTYNIDLVLFMIDAAANLTYSEDRNQRDFNPLDLAEYRHAAETATMNKQTEIRIAGDDKIVPRKRVLTFRSGDSI